MVEAGFTPANLKCQQALVQLGVHTTAANKAHYHWLIGKITVALFTPGYTRDWRLESRDQRQPVRF